MSEPATLAIGEMASAKDLLDKKILSLRAAKQIAAKIRALADAEPEKDPITIAIVDDSGSLIYVERADGTTPVTADVAIGKARASALFGRPSKLLENRIDEGARAGYVTMMNTAGSHNVVMVGGGFPIKYDNKIVGAIGLSGRHGGEDEKLIKAALKSMD